MPASNTAIDALPTAVGLAYVVFLTSIPPDVVLGAFTGSVLFLLGVSDKPKWQWLLFFFCAFVVGILGAEPGAYIANGVLRLMSIEIQMPFGLMALLISACAVNLIGWVRDNPAAVLRSRNAKEHV